MIKFRNFLFVFLYFLAFALAGYLLYTRYYHKLFSDSGQNIPQGHPQLIYYTSSNDLYQLNPLVSQNPNDIPASKIQSTGEILSLEVDPDNNRYFYNTISPEGDYQIWKVSLKDNSSEKLFSNATPGLETFSKFRHPKLSLDNKELAFIASLGQVDFLFLWNIENQSLSNSLLGKFQGKISDFSWGSSGEIYFAGKENNKNVIKLLKDKSITDFLTSSSPITQVAFGQGHLIVAKEGEQKTINLSSVTTTGKKEISQSDVVYPKTVTDFSLSLDGKYLSYEIKDRKTQKSDIYVTQTDGTNLLQLTTDGQSKNPVFSPDSSQVAFLQDETFIFTIDIGKKQRQKILNSKKTIDMVLNWR